MHPEIGLVGEVEVSKGRQIDRSPARFMIMSTCVHPPHADSLHRSRLRARKVVLR